MSIDHRAARRWSAWPRVAAWGLLWFVVAGLVVLPHMHAYQLMSPIDELAHTDYMDKVGHGHLVTEGDKLGQVAMREESCRGQDPPYSYPTPPCVTPKIYPRMFMQKGYNTVYSDPPGYYVVTAVLARGVRMLPGVDGFVTSGRSVGIFWLAAGLGATFLLGLRLGANRVAAAGATLLVATTPAVVHVSATITSDAANLLVGGLLILTVLAVTERRLSRWWILPAAVLCGVVKLSLLSVIGAAALFLILDWWLERRASASSPPEPGAERVVAQPTAGVRRRTTTRAREPVLLSPLVLLLVGAFIPVVVWSFFSGSVAAQDSPIPMRHTFYVKRIDLPELVDASYAMVSPIRNSYVPRFLATRPVLVISAFVNVLLLLGTAGLAWFGSWRDPVTRWAAVAFTSMVVSGPVLVVLIFIGSHAYIPIPSRYALGLVPLAAGTLATAASQRRAGGWSLLGLGVVAMSVLLHRTLM